MSIKDIGYLVLRKENLLPSRQISAINPLKYSN